MILECSYFDPETKILIKNIAQKYKLTLLNSYEDNFLCYSLDLFEKEADWRTIVCEELLTENFIRLFQDKLDWNLISYHQIPVLSDEFIREFKDKVDWYWIGKKRFCSKDFKKEFAKELGLNCEEKMDKDFKYISPWDQDVEAAKKLSEEFVKLNMKYPDKKYSNGFIVSMINVALQQGFELSPRPSEKMSDFFIKDFERKVDWIKASKQYKSLSEDFIREFQDKVIWSQISINQKLSEDFIREMKDKVEWNNISSSHSLSEDFIREFKNKVNWDFIVQKPYLSDEFKQEFSKELGLDQYMNTTMYSNELISLIRSIATDSGCVDEFINLTSIDSKSIAKFKYQVDWVYISREKILTEEFIREFKYNVNWKIISVNQKLSENFIREFANKLDWKYISIHQSLGENFIREFQDKVDWNEISKCQALSEEFILEFKDKVNWDAIASFQNYSSEFEEKYDHLIQGSGLQNLSCPDDFEVIRIIKDIAKTHGVSLSFENNQLTEASFKAFKENIDWGCVSQFEKLSEKFIEEFQNEVNWEHIIKHQRLSIEFVQKFGYKFSDNSYRTFLHRFGLQEESPTELEIQFENQMLDLNGEVQTYSKEINSEILYLADKYNVKLFCENNIITEKTLINSPFNWELIFKNEVLLDDFKQKICQILNCDPDYPFPNIPFRVFLSKDRYLYRQKTTLLTGIKELGKSAAHGAELAIVGSAQEVAYNTVVSKLGISKELSSDPVFKAGIKLIIPALLFLGSVAFENKIPHLEYLKPILKMSVEETTRENTQMILDLLSEVGYAMYQAYIKPETTNKKMRINIDYDSLKVPKLRSLAKEKGLTGYSTKKREEIINMLQESDSEEFQRSTNEYIN